MGHIKKALFKIHQVTGTFLSLMFVIWFLSGIVLLFDGYPHASREKRFLHLEPLKPHDFAHIQALPDSFKGRRITITRWQDRPVFRVPAGKRAQHVYEGQTFKSIASFPLTACKEVATSYINAGILDVRKIDALDQWIPWSYYTPFLPVYKCYMDDASHSVIYVSSKTGSIIQHTNRRSRWMARLGAIPHWIYFKSLRTKTGTWLSVVTWLAVMGVLVSLSGIIAGILRLQKRKKWQKQGLSPYRKLWFRWHHLSGFFFGFFVFTFILSGLFSLVELPDWLFPGEGNFYPGREWDASAEAYTMASYNPLNLYAALEAKEGVRKLELNQSMDKPVWWVYYDNYQVPEVYQIEPDSVYKRGEISLAEVDIRAKKCFSNKHFKVDVLDSYNNYYQESGMRHHPLPVYRIQWQNVSHDVLYIDPATGKAIKSINQRKRIHRWLYQGLHKYNTHFLKTHEPLRKLLIIILSAGGLTVSISGVVLGGKWLKRKMRKYKKQIL
jgi:uncharacterized iron-regulated membrane protein